MQYGLAKIHFVQEKLGVTPDATFISTPDMTVTRNVNRWRSGFGYGGKISWGNGDHEFIVLNVKPNCCGMYVGGLQEVPDVSHLIQRIVKLQNKDMKLDGVKLSWDFSKGNHFIDIFRVKSSPGYSFPPYAFVIHSSGSELRGDNQFGFGLYYDKSPKLMELAETIETPFGDLQILTGENARKYYEFHNFVDEFVQRRRKIAADFIFGDHELISNVNHQKLVNMNEIILGSHQISDNPDDDNIFPLMIRPDHPAHFVKGVPNLADEQIKNLKFSERADKHGVRERLKNANILPHGAGYAFQDIVRNIEVFEVDGTRYFSADICKDRGKKIFADLSSLEFIYRGRDVVLKTIEVGLGELAAKLIPVYVLKM
jgi:hypothetical protein